MNIKTLKASVSIVAVLALGAVFLSLRTRETAAQTPTLHVVASVGVRPGLLAVLAQIEHSTGQKVTTEFDASKPLREKLQAGGAFDVAILTAGDIDTLIKDGKIAANTKSDFAHAGVGIGNRAGAPKPDIKTAEALKKTLLSTKSITLNPIGASTINFNTALGRLQISDSVTPKYLPNTDLEKLATNIVEGKADLVIALVPEIMHFKGVQLIGPLPADLQTYVNFVAGAASNAHAEASKALIKSLTASAAAPLLKAQGLEPR